MAIGTSMPELMITVTSARKENVDLIIGNAIGSNFCNLLLILGIMSVINPVKIDKDTRKFHLPVAIFSALIILSMGTNMFRTNVNTIGLYSGLTLIFMFLIYFAYPIFVEIKDIMDNYKNKELGNKINVLMCIFNIIIGVVLLKFGGDFVVDNSIKIATMLNVSQTIIGMTIIAVGTAMPELITSIVATIKKDSDLAIGNLVGSCALNLFLILGIGALITPLTFSAEFNLSLILLAVATAIIWLLNFMGKKHTITRTKGFGLMCMYAMYMVYLIKIDNFIK